MRTITVLGSTGSICANTLDVIRKNRHISQVYALAAGKNISDLAGQISEFKPCVVVLPESGGLDKLRVELTARNLPRSDWPEMGSGTKALVEISACSAIDTVI